MLNTGLANTDVRSLPLLTKETDKERNGPFFYVSLYSDVTCCFTVKQSQGFLRRRKTSSVPELTGVKESSTPDESAYSSRVDINRNIRLIFLRNSL